MPSRPQSFRPLAQTRKVETRPSSRQRGYDWKWEQCRVLALKQDNHLCRSCTAKGIDTPANIVDHIEPLHVRPDLRLVLSNLQVLCAVCHAEKTEADCRKYGSAEEARRGVQQGSRE